MNDPVVHDADEEERRRRLEEEMERMLLEQEAAELEETVNREAENLNDDIPLPQEGDPFFLHEHQLRHEYEAQQTRWRMRKLLPSYASMSFGSAFALLWYALRTRQQWYLALVYLGSSKYAYIILGNALIALCISIFKFVTTHFLGGLRLVESEGLGDFFRWNVTETCLALTMFRRDMNVQSGILFLFLILSKCLHWVVDMRESHLRMTQDAIVVPTPGTSRGIFGRMPTISPQQLGLQALINILLVTDVIGVVCCIQDVAAYGASVMLLFGFECAIMLVSCMSLTLLWNMHVVDGLLHYWHDEYGYSRWLHAWKDRKATLIFALEVQAQGAKFIFYCTFFAIVMTYYGPPINLFREVYVSFQTLKLRLAAFSKYRKLVQSMNRFSAPPEDHDDMSCIICRDAMTVHDAKQLPGCGHVFHTCCLREWLVQQQTCPTCRGDIRVDAPTAARPNSPPQPVDTPPDEQNEVEQTEPTQDSMPGAVAPPRNAMETVEEDDNAPEPGLPDWREGLPRGKKHRIVGTVATKSSLVRDAELQGAAAKTTPRPRSPSIFPAMYKVIATPSSPVYHIDKTNSAPPTLIRSIPTGTAVVCLDMEVQTMAQEVNDDELCLMLQIAGGGWVWEDQLEFVASIPVDR